VSYLTAAAHLLRSGEPPSTRIKPTLLAIADPSPASGTAISKDLLDWPLRSAGLSQAFPPLPRAAEEIERIGDLFDKAGTTLLVGAAATESRYKALAGRFRFVHLATHAVAADERPLYSTLILTPEPGTGEDGALQAYEILRCPLEASLVVLSACETALGPVGRGEGLAGLVAAFRQAGARSVVATQWSIDESAADLMAAFYKALTAGRGTADALREAKLSVLKKRLRLGTVEISLAHPFFWAPFVLIGGTD